MRTRKLCVGAMCRSVERFFDTVVKIAGLYAQHKVIVPKGVKCAIGGEEIEETLAIGIWNEANWRNRRRRRKAGDVHTYRKAGRRQAARQLI